MAKTLGNALPYRLLGGWNLGFIPGITKEDMLLGIFMVNKMHSIVHIASGRDRPDRVHGRSWSRRLVVQNLPTSVCRCCCARVHDPNGMLLGMISNNPADTGLHVALAAAMLIIGFAAPKQAARLRPSPILRPLCG
jgi:hypothetical protein